MNLPEIRHLGNVALGDEDPSLDSYDQPPRISQAEISQCLPTDTPQEERERVSREEVDRLEREREQGQGARDKLRHLLADLAEGCAERLRLEAEAHGIDEERGIILVGKRPGFYLEQAQNLTKRAARLRGCTETVAALAHECGYVAPVSASSPTWYCQLRDCPECQRAQARAAREIGRFILEKGRIRHELRFLTLTVRSVPRLELVTVGPKGGVKDTNALSALSDCFREFRERFEDKHAIRVCWTCKGMIPSKRTRKIVRELERAQVEPPEHCLKKGERAPWAPLCRGQEDEDEPHSPAPRPCRIRSSMRSIEVTWHWDKGENRWHPHLHVIADMPWVEQAVLAIVWQHVTLRRWPKGASNAMGVDVRMPYVKTKDGKKLLKDVQDPEELARGLVEVLKYPTKLADFLKAPAEIGRQGFFEWTVASARRKLRQATGKWEHWQERLDELEREETGEKDPEELPEIPVCMKCGEEDGRWYKIGVRRPLPRSRTTPERSCETFEQPPVPIPKAGDESGVSA